MQRQDKYKKNKKESLYTPMIKDNILPHTALQNAKQNMIGSLNFNAPYFRAASTFMDRGFNLLLLEHSIFN